MKRKPLSLLDQWCVLQCAVSDKELKPSGTALAVLFRLLDHQNPKTGQCNPSIGRLARDINVCRRTVNSAITQLENRGYVVREKAQGRPNSYRIPRASERTSLEQSVASGDAGVLQKPLQRTAPKKEKKREKKNEAPKPKVWDTTTSFKPGVQALQGAEKDVVAALERLGAGYDDLMTTPEDRLLRLLECVARNDTTPTNAAPQVIDWSTG